MITTQFYKGQGFGNQLWVYSVLRAISAKKGFEFGIQSPEKFKGRGFLDLDMGKKVLGIKTSGPSRFKPIGIRDILFEDFVVHKDSRINLTPLDCRINTLRDKTKIEGYFQSESIIIGHKREISEWFKANETQNLDKDLCIINFRGGDYRGHTDLILGINYYQNAIKKVLENNSNARFGIVTDDPDYAELIFPDIEILSNKADIDNIDYDNGVDPKKLSRDFSMIQNASHLILSNSSFSWWGAWTNQNTPFVVAPKYWARHNLSNNLWSPGNSLTSSWYWLGRDGTLDSYETCFKEWQQTWARLESDGKLEIISDWYKRKNHWESLKSRVYRLKQHRKTKI